MKACSPVVLIFVAALATAAVVKGQTPPAAQAGATAPAGNAETGKKLYNSYGCYQCHGYEAQGGAAGPRLGPRPMPYPAFSRYVRQPTNQMPPYTVKVVTDAELADIYAYVQSRPAPPPADSIPLLKQ
jgi:ubiquinol-cytochrome c reductase cytochrome c subunit